MQTPYTRHFIEALEDLLQKGAVVNQAEFCRTMGLDENAISAYRRGARNVTIETLNKQFTFYRVSLKYLFTGKGDIMEPSPKDPTPEEKTDLEKRLAIAEATTRLQQNIIEEKNKQLADKEEEIKLLRELLKKEVKLLRKGKDSSTEKGDSSTK